MTSSKNKNFIIGLLLTFVVALFSFLVAKLPVLDKVGALTIAILIAIFYRHFKGYPEAYRSGITFSSKYLLRFAIILYGLKLNIFDIIGQGSKLLAIDVGVVIFSIGMMLLVNRLLNGDKNIALLLGVGTGICGAAAIAAVAPIFKSKENDTAISIGIIALIGTIFSLIYTAIFAVFSMTTNVYGAWSGVSLHEIAHVVLAGGFGGSDALKIALLGKLGRVFLLIPLTIVLVLVMRFKSSESTEKSRVSIPYFLIGFVIMALVNTYITIPPTILNILNTISTICLLMAMVALGLNVAFKDLKNRALKPLVTIVITSICLSTLAFIVVHWLYS
ncbi:YeiH family putative sulfate export transporter [Staphylococcus simiae]|uniref:YeiH family protein n=1 Tax=Staphylococcus simiae TaxID=308354 RepID=UPI001A97B28E|nr:YeiH family protein [Staphylococcus simiae]MBO1198711.1 YeiH family putative sulfate export transporter [Staphylococcus simiae]MBO1200963.1 YeiH family putative sulfate export transporter [Staphylococcus simiae]MBO1203192.1 YeiH family putative sulfate export transporter [Staphylococcus simiae]MBO1210700.1 YeiH family putative sulfate export transporter [Staphylococcus simiae]MBO1229301.1 YeiH family putative sulfate export transporter [Staphylococcus simiae]